MTYLNQLPETGFLRLPEVLKFFPVSRATWWNRVKTGQYPKGYKLSPAVTAWKAEDIRQLIEVTTLQETQKDFQGNNFSQT